MSQVSNERMSRIAERQQQIKLQAAGKYIKFKDGEVKSLAFQEPLDGEMKTHDFKLGNGPEEKLDFFAFQIDENNNPCSNEVQSWTVGNRVAATLLDYFSTGNTVLKVKRLGAMGDPNTTYRIEKVG
jgi:hypothetical protein